MSRLSDLYKAMETLRKEGLSFNEDLETQYDYGAEVPFTRDVSDYAERKIKV